MDFFRSSGTSVSNQGGCSACSTDTAPFFSSFPFFFSPPSYYPPVSLPCSPRMHLLSPPKRNKYPIQGKLLYEI